MLREINIIDNKFITCKEHKKESAILAALKTKLNYDDFVSLGLADFEGISGGFSRYELQRVINRLEECKYISVKRSPGKKHEIKLLRNEANEHSLR